MFQLHRSVMLSNQTFVSASPFSDEFLMIVGNMMCNEIDFLSLDLNKTDLEGAFKLRPESRRKCDVRVFCFAIIYSTVERILS